MRNVQRAAKWATVGMLALLGSGCTVYDPALIKKGATPPARPASSTEAPDTAPLTFAIRDVILNQQPADDQNLWKSIGFDLDGFDTTSATSSEVECLPPGSHQAQIDGNRGIDNNLGARFYPQIQITQELQNLEADARASHAAGHGTFVFYVEGYNGTANDPHIQVTIGQAVAGTPDDPATVSFVNGELVVTSTGLPATPPAWDGTDHWYLSDASFLMGSFDQPQIHDANAYIADNTLVVHLPVGTTIYFSTETVTVKVKLNEGVAVGPLLPDHSGGGPITIAGRWYKQDITATAGSAGICDQGLVNILAGVLDAIVDVTNSPPSDPGPDIDCEALSVGVLFEKAVAGIGPPVVVPGQPPPDACAMMDAGVADGGVP